MNLFELYAKIALDTSEYEAGVNKVEASAGGLAFSIDRSMSSAKSAQSAMERLGESQQSQGAEADKAKKKTDKYGDAMEELGESADEAKEGEGDLEKEVRNQAKEAQNAEKKNKKLKDSHKEQGDEAEKAAEKTRKLGEALKNGLAVGAKVIGAGIAAAASTVTLLTKSAIESYASFEQLKGGVETLFGTGGKTLEEYAKTAGKTAEEVRGQYNTLNIAEQEVFNNAADAYKSVGLSANEYMETVTGFAASLTSSLGGDTVTAAQKADQALRDMSDNSAKLGTSMESIQNAYGGFAKQNYTMLDNLKLGYGGTKEEMERLLADAQKLSGIEYDISSYADIIDAIHVVQDNMGITGTTAREAATTIQGSLAMTKAAWRNLMTGLADETADFPTLISNVVDSASTSFGLLAPRVTTALNGISQLVGQLVPVIVEQIPPIIEGVAPGLFQAATGLFAGLLEGLMAAIPSLMPVATSLITDLVGYLISALPQLLSAGGQIILTLVKGVATALPEMLAKFSEMIAQIAPMLTDPSFVGQIVQAGYDILSSLISGIAEALPTLIKSAYEIILGLALALTDPANLSSLIDSAIDLVMALVDGVVSAMPVLISQAPMIIQNLVTGIVQNLPKLLEAGISLPIEMIKGIAENFPAVIAAGGEIIGMLLEGIVDLIGGLFGIGEDTIEEFKNGIKSAWNGLVSWFSNLWDNLFGNRKVGVTVEGNASGADGSHANGLSYVPYNGYMAELHRGEMVVPAGQAEELRSGGSGSTDALLRQILTAIEDGNDKDTVLKINNREFGRAVRGVVGV